MSYGTTDQNGQNGSRIDGEIARELSKELKELNLTVGKLAARFDEALPYMKQQTEQVTHGLQALENRLNVGDGRNAATDMRVQRLEDAVTTLKDQIKEERENSKARTETTHRLITTAAAILTVIIAAAAFFVATFKFK